MPSTQQRVSGGLDAWRNDISRTHSAPDNPFGPDSEVAFNPWNQELTIQGHGNRHGINRLNAEAVVKTLLKVPAWRRQYEAATKIKLQACQTASERFAQKLADLTGKEVRAPSTTWGPIKQDVEWVTYKPRQQA